MEGQVEHLPESFGELGPDAMSPLVASWPGGLTAFVETAGLHSRTLHLMSLLGQKKILCRLAIDVIWTNRAPIIATSCCVFFLMAYLATGHSEHLFERYDGSSLMELHQVVQTAMAPVLPDYDALSVIWRIDHKVSAAVFSTEGGGRLNSSKGWRGPDFVRHDWGCVGCEKANHCANSVPIWEGVADPALTDPDEEVTRRLGHQQHLCRPAQIINRHLV